ncbi:MAG TPA: indole-3-glycerol phosphate synthase TrpC [Rhodospirillales bacterium]|nr:indole-3-glycerol phosphate synthase TrpC [Rhodospirillales bacterium]
MSDLLARICADKRQQTRRRIEHRPFSDVRAAARQAPSPRGFAARLEETARANGYGLIAEIKRASPSKGLIRADFDPPALAQAYMAGGAACLSVLTDIPYFLGTDEFLVAARAAVTLPVLRKDFLLDPYQIVEARALGADCVLLIMAILDDGQARELESAAMDYGMDVLVEIHGETELERALELQAHLIGINNRNLESLVTDIATTERLAPLVPAGRVIVSESGLKTPDDLARMSKAGANCFLVGEALMIQSDVAAAARALLGRPQTAAVRA